MMADLNGVIEEARDEGYPVPSSLAVSNAKLLLERLYRFMPWRYEVYPTQDAEIVIDVPGGGISVLVFCDSNGGALCMANLPDERRAKAYSTIEHLPDSFIRESLTKLKSAAS